MTAPGYPTVREVVALDAMQVGSPRVVAGAEQLDRAVRWVHSSEVPDIASLLRGGELVLTTGIGLPADDDGIRAFIRELAEVGVSGLVVELGRRYPSTVPRVMAVAAEKLGLPLVELRRPTPFVQITEAVHARIVDAQLTELRATEEIHQRFTELSVEGAEPAEVVHQAAQLSGCPVVLENLGRKVLAFDAAGGRAEPLLDGWEQHSRQVRVTGRTGYDGDAGWLVTTVGARGQDWGRLLLRWPADGPPPTRLTILLERAASTLALGRLIRRDEEGLERQLHGTLLAALLDHSLPVDEVALRARALGVPLDRRRLVGVVVRPLTAETEVTAAQARLRDLADATTQAVREAKLAGLTSALDGYVVGALLAVKSGTDEDVALTRFAAALRKGREEVLIAAGSGVDSLREARRSLVEARQVADAARHDTPSSVPVLRLPNVGLAGLLHLLRDEPRLQTFVERQLGALLAYDAKHPRDPLLPTLRVYLESGRNKSIAAAAAHLSRPAFYERLARIGRVLGVDLDSVPACLSLHVALLAWEAIRSE
ncbi:MAG: PucR family transcriptional regulator [Hamadaea sp.]|uniref:PucR family transcriptional regulator n=1 Tax=Hamadaea sp. TaxID=2024425 RepID=UPI0017CB3A0F|nr:PucR family transcriptional regulator ligand-binding domain-containing protein [Hamadaea sp.]NUR72077.1 PucR family transcriptional regulator [Hamadaea sp.]NUT23113.1 PucR family transcriptional regulator [Hamadaea sp.]